MRSADNESVRVAPKTLAAPILVTSVLLPFVIAASLCVWWTRNGELMLGGDEPHYLIMARSVALDGDFDLKGNYEEEALTGWIYGGRLVPHAFQGGLEWPPFHSPGLGVLLALPFGQAGLDGVRLALAAFTIMLSAAIFLWMRRQLDTTSTVLLALALGLSVPLAFGASQVYPDMPSAAILAVATLALIEWWERRVLPDTRLWLVVWTLVGFLPWLQSRFLAPWLLLVAAGGLIALGAPVASRLRLLAGILPACAGLLALFWFNQTHYDSILGPPRWGELTRSSARATMIFLGLHLDRSQGLFVQQPLWLLGLVAAATFARVRPTVALWLALLYLATIVPPAMQMGRYGGAGPIGRYGWPAAFLWIVPIRYWLESGGERAARWFRVALIGAVVAQVILAAHWWIQGPATLGPNLDEGLAARDSLPPPAIGSILPSFYFWDFQSHWVYPPNLVGMAVALILIVAGIRWARRAGGSGQAPVVAGL